MRPAQPPGHRVQCSRRSGHRVCRPPRPVPRVRRTTSAPARAARISPAAPVHGGSPPPAPLPPVRPARAVPPAASTGAVSADDGPPGRLADGVSPAFGPLLVGAAAPVPGSARGRVRAGVAVVPGPDVLARTDGRGGAAGVVVVAGRDAALRGRGSRDRPTVLPDPGLDAAQPRPRACRAEWAEDHRLVPGAIVQYDQYVSSPTTEHPAAGRRRARRRSHRHTAPCPGSPRTPRCAGRPTPSRPRPRSPCSWTRARGPRRRRGPRHIRSRPQPAQPGLPGRSPPRRPQPLP